MATNGYRELLLTEFAKRKQKNPHYSLRAFARDLRISTTALSETLSRKRRLSRKNLMSLADRLGLSPKQTEAVLREANRSARNAQDGTRPAEVLDVKEELFRLISDWHYFAILNLARIPSSRADTAWIASRLGISEIEARDALERLQRLGFLEARKGRLKRTALPIRTSEDVPSSALRAHHRQNLHRAELALDGIDVSLREVSSVTLAVDTSELPAAKEMIREFQKRFMKRFGARKPDQVYTFAVQFFPPIRPEKNEELK